MHDLDSAKASFKRIIEDFKTDLSAMRAGRPTPEMFANVTVSAYGSQSPLNTVGNINVVDATLVTVQVWDKNLVPEVIKALQENGYNPQEDGELIRIPIPTMTQEKRQEYVKELHNMAEEAKIKGRMVRKDTIKYYDHQKEEGLSEDRYNSLLKKLQDEVDKLNQEIDRLSEEKEKSLLTV